MKVKWEFVLSGVLLFFSDASSQNVVRNWRPAIEFGSSRSSFGFNDYIGSRFTHTENKLTFNAGVFLEWGPFGPFALMPGIRGMQIHGTFQYSFQGAAAFYKGTFDLRRNYFRMPLRFKLGFGGMPRVFVFAGPELWLLISEWTENIPSEDYQKYNEYDDNPLFCEDCGYGPKRTLFGGCYGFGVEFKVFKRIFYLMASWSSAKTSSNRCPDYSAQEFNVSLGYKF